MRHSALLLAALTVARVRAVPPPVTDIGTSASLGAVHDDGHAELPLAGGDTASLDDDDDLDVTAPIASSNGFALAGNVTGPGCDGTEALAHEVTGLLVHGYHAGAGRAAAILHDADPLHPGLVFYLNGTGGPVPMSLLSDSGQPQVPFGLLVPQPAGGGVNTGDGGDGGDGGGGSDGSTFHSPYPDPDGASVSLRAGPGTPATVGTPKQGVINMQGTGTFLACNRSLAYNQNSWVVTLNYLYETGGENAADRTPSQCKNGVTPADAPAGIPDDCVPITLVPICAKLPPAQVGGYANHAYSHPVECLYIPEYDELEGVDELDEEGWGAEWGMEHETEAAEPEGMEPEVETEAAAPEAAEPEVDESEAAEPEVVEPEGMEPEVTEPEGMEPEVTEPEAVAPEQESGAAETTPEEEEQAPETSEQVSELAPEQAEQGQVVSEEGPSEQNVAF